MVRRGWTMIDLVVAVVAIAILTAVSVVVAEPTGRAEKLAQSLSNLRAIGVASAQYRHDNRDYLPFVGIGPSPRGVPAAGQSLSAWATWSFGGKNCNAFWFNSFGGFFDVEAADRPLNQYVYPGFTYTAPPPPQRLPANSPARLSQQGKVYQDPADLVGHQQNWPNANPASGGRPPLSCYDDIGTSYHQNMSWDDQLASRISNFTARFNEGTRRMAVGQGVDPARFVTYHDEWAAIVLNRSAPFSAPGNHGVTNASPSLFYDGHAALITYTPGFNRAARITPTYSVWFEDLPRPTVGSGTGPTAIGGQDVAVEAVEPLP